MAEKAKATRQPLGKLVATSGDFKIYIYEHREEGKKGILWRYVTVVNKQMKFNSIKASTHTVNIGYEFKEKP